MVAQVPKDLREPPPVPPSGNSGNHSGGKGKKNKEGAGKGGNKTPKSDPGQPSVAVKPDGSGHTGDGKTPPYNPKVVCFGCKEIGHIKPKCQNKHLWAERRNAELPKVQTIAPDASTPHVSLTLGVFPSKPEDFVHANALLDTGSTVNILSTKLLHTLTKFGLVTRAVSKELATASQTKLKCTQEVDILVNIPAGVLPKPFTHVPMTCLVVDCGEDLIISFAWLREHSLLSLLLESAPTSSPVLVEDSQAEVEECSPTYERKFIEDASFRSSIDNLVKKYEKLFDPIPSSGASVPSFEIELKEDAAIKPIPPRRLSPKLLGDLREEVTDLLQKGIIRPSTSPYSFPVVMIKKSDNTWRKCVDYRDLNKATVDLKYPLQNYRDILGRLSGNSVFATLDLRQGFLQIGVSPKSVPYTAFATPDGLYEYVRMPFGLKNAPSYFQKIISDVLHELIGVCCEVFIDDIIVYGATQSKFLANLARVFQLLLSKDLRLKREKCFLGLSQVEYVGHIVNSVGVTLSNKRREALQNMPPPTSTASLRSFLGIANYFRPFVPDYAQLSKPLTALCSPKVAFKWTQIHTSAFEKIKHSAVHSPLLAFIDYSAPLILRTDASTLGVGGILFQPGEKGKEVAVAYVSKAFTETERKWSTIEQEAFAIYYCIRQLEHYLNGHKFFIETDHRNLTYLYKSTVPKLVRWRLALMEHDYEVKHIAGKDNTVADALSRVLAVGTVQDVRASMEAVHNAIIGHKGLNATLELLKSNGSTWPGMNQDVQDFISSCATCQKVRLGQGSMAAALHTTAVFEPYSVIEIDTIGPLPSDSEDNKYIICGIDCFTRFVELKATKDATAKSAANFLLEIVGRYGPPAEVRSDQGPQYSAKIITEFLQLFKVKARYSLPYRPQANGIVERANGEVMRHLRALVLDERVENIWSLYLPIVQRVINSTPHSATGSTPMRLMFGDAVTCNRELLTTGTTGPTQCVEDYIQKLNERVQLITKLSQDHQQRVVDEYLAKSPETPTTFNVGDYVLVSYPNRPPTKLNAKWRGPLIIVEVSGNTYTCQNLTTLKNISYDISRLKKFHLSDGINPKSIAAADTCELEVEAIVDHRGSTRKRSKMKFRVRWLGYEPEEDTWEPFKNVKDLQALDEYVNQHPKLRL